MLVTDAAELPPRQSSVWLIMTLGRKPEMQNIAYIDVDDTLIRSVGTKRIPIPTTVAKVKELKASGWLLYCWSSGGEDYARESATELGIDACFTGFLPKPTLMIDDVEPQNWRNLSIIHPAEIK